MDDPTAADRPPIMTRGQYIGLVCITYVSASASIAGSSAIMWIAHRKLRSHPYHRIMFVLSLGDALASVTYLPHILLVESDPSAEWYNPWAFGNAATCAAFGFLTVVLPTFVAFMNMNLSIYFCLKVRAGRTDQEIAGRIEKWGYGLAATIPLLFGIAGLAKDVYRYTDTAAICHGRRRIGSGGLYFLLILLLVSVVGICCTAGVAGYVGRQLERSNAHRFGGEAAAAEDEHQKARLRTVREQAVMYTCTYLNTFLWIFLASTVSGRIKAPESVGFYILQCLILLFFPSQGFFNFLIYTRRNLRQWKKLNRDKSALWAFRKVLSGQEPTKSSSSDPCLRESSTRALGRGGLGRGVDCNIPRTESRENPTIEEPSSLELAPIEDPAAMEVDA